MALLIGLTGGIGSGKSTVARLFEERGAGIIDTDAIARELTQPGGAAIPAIRAAFGDELINTAGCFTGRSSPERTSLSIFSRRRYLFVQKDSTVS